MKIQVFDVEQDPLVTCKNRLEIRHTLGWVFADMMHIIIGNEINSFTKIKTLLFIVIHFSLPDAFFLLRYLLLFTVESLSLLYLLFIS